MERKERSKQIQSALQLLTEEHRTILILREVEQMSYETLANLFQLPVGTIRSRLHRARMCLREVSSHYLERDDP